MPLLFRLFKLNFCNSTWFYLRNSFQLINRRFLHESYYDILKITETCSPKDVRDAFIALAKKNHPDKSSNDPSMHERFIRINEAYSVLINPLSRRAYDLTLNQKRKIGEPPYRPRKYNYSSNYTVEKEKKAHSNSRSSAHRNNSKSNTTNRANAHTAAADEYYGVKGVKRVSNRRVAIILILFASLAVYIQLIVIRQSVKRSREKTMERNRKYAAMEAMSKEKAKLYGNEYHINLLKKSLIGSFGDENIEPKDDGNLDVKEKDNVNANKGYPQNQEPQPFIRPTAESNVGNSGGDEGVVGTYSTNKTATGSVPMKKNNDDGTLISHTGDALKTNSHTCNRQPPPFKNSSNLLTHAQEISSSEHIKTVPPNILNSPSSSVSSNPTTALNPPHLPDLTNLVQNSHEQIHLQSDQPSPSISSQTKVSCEKCKRL